MSERRSSLHQNRVWIYFYQVNIKEGKIPLIFHFYHTYPITRLPEHFVCSRFVIVLNYRLSLAILILLSLKMKSKWPPGTWGKPTNSRKKLGLVNTIDWFKEKTFTMDEFFEKSVYFYFCCCCCCCYRPKHKIYCYTDKTKWNMRFLMMSHNTI